jgi:tyrosyl-tRNA synthetase
MDEAEIAARRDQAASGDLHPKQVKLELARRITADYHGDAAARQAEEEFDRVFAGGGVPDEIAEHVVDGARPLLKLLAAAELATSNKEARRLVQQGAVSVDGERLDDPLAELPARPEPYLFKVGKRRFARITIR